MTVTEIRQRRAATEAALTGLAQKVADAIDDSLAVIQLETARAMANETGVHRFQEMLLDSEDQLRDAQQQRRRAGTALGEVEREFESVMNETTWLLEATHFVTRANKQWLAVDAAGNAIDEDDQKSFDADARKAWITHHARKRADVADAFSKLSAAKEAVLQADDDIRAITTAAQNARHLLDSARVELETLAVALKAPARTRGSNGEKS